MLHALHAPTRARPSSPLLSRGQDACDTLCGDHVASLAASLTAAITFGGSNSVTEAVLHPWGRGVAGDEEDDLRGALQASAGDGQAAGGPVSSSRFISGMQDGSLSLWRVPAGLREHHYPGHGWGAAVRCCSVLPPGGRCVTGSTDSSVCLWRLQDGALERQLVGHTDTVRAVLPLPDGRVLSGSDDRSLRVWNLGSGECEEVITAHTGGVWALALLADGSNRVASGAWDATVRLWTMTPGHEAVCVATLVGHTKEVLALAPLPSSSRLVSSSADATLRLWDADTGACERAVDVGKGGIAHCLAAVGPARVLAGCGDGAVRVWYVDPGAARCERVLKGHSDGVFSIALLPDGAAVTGSSDKSLSVWALNARQHVLVPPLAAGAVWALAPLGEQPSLAALSAMWPPPEQSSGGGGSGRSPRAEDVPAGVSEDGGKEKPGFFC